MCKRCEARGWTYYCLDEAEKANCFKPPMLSDEVFARATNPISNKDLGELLGIHMDSGAGLELVLRVTPRNLQKYPDILSLCKRMGVNLEVIHAVRREQT